MGAQYNHMTTPTGACVDTPGAFTDGLSLWANPGFALTATQNAIANVSTSFSSAQLPYTAGLLAPPVLLLLVILGGMGGRR